MSRTLGAPRSFVALCALFLVLSAAFAAPAAKDPAFGDKRSAFKKTLKPWDEKRQPTPPAADDLVKTVQAFAATVDGRVFKELFRSVKPAAKAMDKAETELDEATAKLRQSQRSYFSWVEDEFERTGKLPESALVVHLDSLRILGEKEKKAAGEYDRRVRVREAILAGLGANLAALGDERAAVWKEAKKLGTTSKDPSERAAFAAALAALPDAECETTLLAMVTDPDVEVRVAVLDSLSERRSVPGLERSIEALGDDRWEVVVAAIRGLAKYRDARVPPALIARIASAEGRVLDALFDTLLAITGKHRADTHQAWEMWWEKESEEFLKRWDPDTAKRRTVVEDLSFTDPKQIDVAAELAALLPTEPDAEVRLDIISNIAMHRSYYARVTLMEALEDDEKEIRLAAINGLGRYRHITVPEALMKRVKTADTEELQMLFIALRTLWGGRDEFTVAKPDREALFRWWDTNKDRVGAQFVRLGAQNIAEGRDAQKEEESSFANRSFYGIKLRSSRVLFIVDVSFSMNDPAKAGKERTKLDVAKSELSRVIQALPEDGWFGLIVFSGIPEIYEQGMAPANAKAKKKAIEWINALTGRTGTNVYDPLEMGFRLGTPKAPVKSETTPDTIYLVSDGQPNWGKFTDPATILEYVGRMNERRGLKIHCIGVGEDHDVEFLSTLARKNDGLYVAR